MSPEDDGGVIGFGPEIDAMFRGGGQGDLQFRVAPLDSHQPGNQPANGAGRRLQAYHGLLLTSLFCHCDQTAKRRLELRVEGAALRRKMQAARVAGKKRETKPRLQRRNLAADGALSQAEFARGMG